MTMMCRMLGHRRADAKRWDGEFYHSTCTRCGAPMVRLSGHRDWREPTADEQRYFDKMQEIGPAAASG